MGRRRHLGLGPVSEGCEGFGGDLVSGGGCGAGVRTEVGVACFVRVAMMSFQLSRSPENETCWPCPAVVGFAKAPATRLPYSVMSPMWTTRASGFMVPGAVEFVPRTRPEFSAPPGIGGGVQHLRPRHDLDEVPVEVSEVDERPTVTRTGLHVVRRVGAAAVRDALGLDPSENLVELLFADVERLVMGLKAIAVLEVEPERLVHSHWREVAPGALVGEAEEVSEERRRLLLVLHGHDGVVEYNGHRLSPVGS